jgi:hypothetical protein
MKKIAIAMGLLLLAADGSAFAQSGGTVGAGSGAAGGSSAGGTASSVLPAPVGHRQPKPSDFQDEKNLSNPDNPANKEDAALDRKIKSICRGC